MKEKIKLNIDFYKISTQETFKKVKKTLLACGCSEEEVNKALETLYYAVADEYGY